MSKVLISLKNSISLEIKSNERWAIIGPNKTNLLKILSSKSIDSSLLCTYPFLKKTILPSNVIQFLEFKNSLPITHLSARYEYFNEFNETTKNFIIGSNSNNKINYNLLEEILTKLKLQDLKDRLVFKLSNGQIRLVRIAKCLFKEPKLLIIDDPFLGLDSNSTNIVNEVLKNLSPNPYIILGLRYQDNIPNWISNIILIDSNGNLNFNKKNLLESNLNKLNLNKFNNFNINKIKEIFLKIKKPLSLNLFEFKNISIKYNNQLILKNLSWKISYGSKWHIKGNNGVGKSTLLSLITAEHPQSWNESIIMYDKPRRTGSSNYFDINKSISFTSPEFHSIYPINHTLYETISTGYLIGSLIPPKNLSKDLSNRIKIYLKEFNLQDKINKKFGELNISDQKLILFIRCLIKNPNLLILDEAFSVMEDYRIEQCKEVLKHYPGTILTVSHLNNELPNCDNYIKLIAPGEYEIGSY